MDTLERLPLNVNDAYEVMREYVRQPLRAYITRNDFIDILTAVQNYMLTYDIGCDTMTLWICWKNLIEQQENLNDLAAQTHKN